VFFDDVASAPTLRRAIRAGRIRRLVTGMYSADLASPPEELVVRNRFAILGRLVPDAILVDRTAAAGGVVTDGSLFAASSVRHNPLTLPGLRIVFRKGSPLDEPVPDPLWSSGLRMASPARTIVDNLARSRSRGGVARTLSLQEMEAWMSRKLLEWGDERFQRLRAQAHQVADALGVPERQGQIDQLFAELRNTGPARRGAAAEVRAIRAGTAWDHARVAKFERLSEVFSSGTPGEFGEPFELPQPATIGEMPFWEAYFSNYIEGTIFTIEEARAIIDSRQVPANRPEDGHDILGTYLCVADPVGRATCSTDPAGLIEQLRARHAAMLSARPNIGPGKFKNDNNRVGSYVFVDWKLVEGTLLKGFECSLRVPRGFFRALHLMFVISETHPFTDGNGRSARVMGNAELSAMDQTRIVVPIVHRNEYLAGLRNLSLHDDPAAYCKGMAHAWRWTAALPWGDRQASEGKMAETNALTDSTEAQERGLRLELP
jgi:hypothetical protein